MGFNSAFKGLTYMVVTLSCFFYKSVLTAVQSLLVLMKALSFALVVTNQEQVW